MRGVPSHLVTSNLGMDETEDVQPIEVEYDRPSRQVVAFSFVLFRVHEVCSL